MARFTVWSLGEKSNISTTICSRASKAVLHSSDLSWMLMSACYRPNNDNANMLMFSTYVNFGYYLSLVC